MAAETHSRQFGKIQVRLPVRSIVLRSRLILKLEDNMLFGSAKGSWTSVRPIVIAALIVLTAGTWLKADEPVVERFDSAALASADDGVAEAFTQQEDVLSLPLPEDPADRISALEQRLEALSKRTEAAEKALSASKSEKAKTEKAPEKPAPKAETKSEFPNFKVTGFIQLDTAFYQQDADNMALVGDAQDGTAFRRARLGVNGKVAEFTGYQLEVDFATAGRPSFFDTYVEQGNLPVLGTVKIGQFCQPFSVDALTSFRNLTFLERSLPFLAMVPFRRVGAQASDTTEDQRTAWAYSLYRSGGFNNAPLGDNRFGADFGDIGGYAVSSRVTHLLQYDDLAADRYLWHIGGGYNFSVLAANDAIGSGTPGNAGTPRPFYQARTTPEFGLGYSDFGGNFGSAVNGTPNFVDTGRYEANSFHLFGFETVYQHGPVGFTAEYMATAVNSVAGPVYYQGAYAQLAYRLTGEHRLYDKKLGTLGKLIPFTELIPLKRDGIRGWGAFEVAARWSVIDLRNPDDLDGHYYNPGANAFNTTANAGNGVMNDSTVGVTWFLNAYTKVQVNWIHAMVDNTASGFSDANLYVSRVQVDF